MPSYVDAVPKGFVHCSYHSISHKVFPASIAIHAAVQAVDFFLRFDHNIDEVGVHGPERQTDTSGIPLKAARLATSELSISLYYSITYGATISRGVS